MVWLFLLRISSFGLDSMWRIFSFDCLIIWSFGRSSLDLQSIWPFAHSSVELAGHAQCWHLLRADPPQKAFYGLDFWIFTRGALPCKYSLSPPKSFPCGFSLFWALKSKHIGKHRKKHRAIIGRTNEKHKKNIRKKRRHNIRKHRESTGKYRKHRAYRTNRGKLRKNKTKHRKA